MGRLVVTMGRGEVGLDDGALVLCPGAGGDPSKCFLAVRWTKASRGFEMPLAFVLINAEIGSEDDVLVEMRKLGNVKESYVVYGVYDIVAKVEAESMDKLKEIVTWKIRRLDKVRSTLTMIVVEGT